MKPMFKVPFKDLPGFTSMNQYPLEHLFYQEKTALEFYKDFKAKIFDALRQKKYLPIMRMCDGEYIYCVGKKPAVGMGTFAVLKQYAAKLLKKQVTSWGETYSAKEDKELRPKFPLMLKEVATHGFIANHYQYSHSHFCEEYIEPMRKWYDGHGINLDSNNYTAFYFVYVLLNGPESLEFFNGRRVLVFSSFSPEKCEATEKELKRRGASKVLFQPISRTKSMTDKIDVSKFQGEVDLALIAGGIGSANILTICKSLNIVCIDSGFCLECIADRSKTSERIFCTPDHPF